MLHRDNFVFYLSSPEYVARRKVLQGRQAAFPPKFLENPKLPSLLHERTILVDLKLRFKMTMKA